MVYGAGLQDGGVGAHEAAFFVVGASLGDYYWAWEVACWDGGSWRDGVACEKGLDYFVDVVLSPFF